MAAGSALDTALDALGAALGQAAVVRDRDRVAAHEVDWTGRFRGHTPAVVSPADTGEVVTLVRWAVEHGIALVPQGGNTGLVAGATPLGGEVVVSTRRLTGIAVDAAAGTLVAGAGETLAAVREAAHRAGWEYAVDLGARDSATIGGTVATNAGGLHVVRHGDTRRQLLGVEAVTGRGEVVGDLRGLVKDNTGYHLPSLLAGSEGTLAIITKVCVRLVPPATEVAAALVGTPSLAAAIEAATTLRRELADAAALEVFLDDGLELVCETLSLPRPFVRRCGAYLLVEAAGPVGVLERLGAAVAELGIDDDTVAVATDERTRAALWRYREAHTECINLVGVPHKLDVTLTPAALDPFVADVRARLAAMRPDAHAWIFGHAGDGNLHVNVTGIDHDDDTVDEMVLGLVASAGGSISAEHGIGRAKVSMLGLNRTAAELDVTRRIAAAFDPAGILNPGVIVVRDRPGG